MRLECEALKMSLNCASWGIFNNYIAILIAFVNNLIDHRIKLKMDDVGRNCLEIHFRLLRHLIVYMSP